MRKSIRLWEPVQAHKAMINLWREVKSNLLAGNKLTLTLSSETRSVEQNRRLHAMLRDISQQLAYLGKKRTSDEWKVLLISAHAVATQGGVEMVRGIEGEYVNIRESSAHMSVSRMTSLMDYITAYGEANNVTFLDFEDDFRRDIETDT